MREEREDSLTNHQNQIPHSLFLAVFPIQCTAHSLSVRGKHHLLLPETQSDSHQSLAGPPIEVQWGTLSEPDLTTKYLPLISHMNIDLLVRDIDPLNRKSFENPSVDTIFDLILSVVCSRTDRKVKFQT